MLTSSQLQQAINAYFSRAYSQYAVLVDGGWGVGKTYLLLNEILPENKDIHYLHISLYGLSSIADIENEIYKQAASHAELNAFLSEQVPSASHKWAVASRTGGISYVVQLLIDGFHQQEPPEEKILVLCFDDLERWSGDLNVCLSYINKVVEQGRIKCVVLGNLDALEDIKTLSNAREKTIRHVYKFENPASAMVDYAMQLVDFQSVESRSFIQRLIQGNLSTLVSLMQRVGEKNIRTLGEALQLYDYIVEHNIETFARSRGLSFTYFVTLLSTLILLKKHFVHKEEREQLVEGNHQRNRGFPLLKKLGYFDSESPGYITRESRALLDTVFYRLDEISLVGVFSIIENGFYIERDFEAAFDDWQQDKLYENYLDQHYFYQLEEQAAETTVQRVMNAVFDQHAVTNPATLLLIAERMLQDINRRVVDLNFTDTRERFISLIKMLYETGAMEVMGLEYLEDQHKRYPLAEDIYRLILGLNDDYLRRETSRRQKSFWQRLAKNPCQYVELLREFDHFEFLKESNDPELVVSSLESLNNAQLYQLAQRLTEQLEANGQGPFLERYAGNAERIWRALELKFETQRGVRARNMEQLGRVFHRISEFVPKRHPLSVLSLRKA